MAWSVDDLSVITDLLTTELTDAVKASPLYLATPFSFEVSGLMPAVSRNDGTNVMSLYLLHVGRDPYWRNTPVQGQRGLLNTSQPLSLNLSYLLTSYSEKNWQMEQYLMSVALTYFHANAIHTTPNAEFTITVEADSIEEMSRLWQAITVPIRLSAMFRVAVIFLTPETPPPAQIRPPAEAALSVGADLNLAAPVPAAEPQLFEVAVEVAYRVPPGSADPSQVTVVTGRPVAAGGQSVRVRGSGLDGADATGVFLSLPGGGSEWPLPAVWRVFGTSASGTAGDADELVLRLPLAYSATPAAGTVLAATPLPGMFLLTVGNPVSGFRSNALPLAIAPEMDGIGPGSPVLTPDGTGTYTMSASGLVAGTTQLLLENTALGIGGAPAPGIAAVDVAAGTVAWMLPSPPGFPSGSFVRVRLVVNAIEAPPGWWVQIP
jgi:hypothetical protein